MKRFVILLLSIFLIFIFLRSTTYAAVIGDGDAPLGAIPTEGPPGGINPGPTNDPQGPTTPPGGEPTLPPEPTTAPSLAPTNTPAPTSSQPSATPTICITPPGSPQLTPTGVGGGTLPTGGEGQGQGPGGSAGGLPGDPGTYLLCPTSVPVCNACKASCSKDSDCCSSYACIAGICQPQCPTQGVGGYDPADPLCTCLGGCPCTSLSCVDTDPNPGRLKIIPEAQPACFNCKSFKVDGQEQGCGRLGDEFTYNRANGSSCRYYSFSVQGQEGAACDCQRPVCCPDCEPPQVVPGYEAGCAVCDFKTMIPGPDGQLQETACPCIGKEITFQSDGFACYDFEGLGEMQCGNPVTHEFNDSGYYDITMYCGGGAICKKTITMACSCLNQPDGNDPNPTPWYKLKDDQFHKPESIDNPIPAVVSAYDLDDSGNPDCQGLDGGLDKRCFNINNAGVVSVAGDTINLNGAPVSYRLWQKTGYQKSPLKLTPAKFLDYVRSRKKVNNITEISQLQKNKVNVYTGNLTIDRFGSSQGQKIIDILEDDARMPYVLIVDGNVNIDADFNITDPGSSPKSLGIITTGTLSVNYAVMEIGGLYITNTLDLSSGGEKPSHWPLKIKGNLVSVNSIDPLSHRSRTDDSSKPSIFVVRDVGLDLNLAGLISQPYYKWEELSP